MRSGLLVLVLMLFLPAGCKISHQITDTPVPSDQPPLERLDEHLHYQDPDAGQPDYVRSE
jgi:hypothetical protein